MTAIKFQSYNFKIPYARKAINVILRFSDNSRRISRTICCLSIARLFETIVQKKIYEQELEISVTACASNSTGIFL